MSNRVRLSRSAYGWTPPPTKYMALVHLRSVFYHPSEHILTRQIIPLPDLEFAIQVTLESIPEFMETLRHLCWVRIVDSGLAARQSPPNSRLGVKLAACCSINWDNTAGGHQPQQGEPVDGNVGTFGIEDLRLQFEMIARRQYRDRLLVFLTIMTHHLEPEHEQKDNTNAWHSNATEANNETGGPSGDVRSNVIETQVPGTGTVSENQANTDTQHNT